jgi:hypothetical protein
MSTSFSCDIPFAFPFPLSWTSRETLFRSRAMRVPALLLSAMAMNIGQAFLHPRDTSLRHSTPRTKGATERRLLEIFFKRSRPVSDEPNSPQPLCYSYGSLRRVVAAGNSTMF